MCDIAEKDYKCEHFSNRDEWTDKVFEGINDDKPSILNVSISNTASLPYNMPDHIVAVTGYSETGNYKVKVLDTFVPGFENRWYDLTTIYEVNRKHKNGMIKR